MKAGGWWALGAVVAAAGGGAWWWLHRDADDADPPADEAEEETGADVPQPKPAGKLVWHRDRAAGARPELFAFLDWWDANGTFRIVVVDKGGVRTDPAEQARLYQIGSSQAETLEETPHGRGAALDLAPYAKGPDGLFAPNFADTVGLAAIGAAAEAFGLKWGGNFRKFKDLPHVEIRGWESLPYPPGAPPAVS